MPPSLRIFLRLLFAVVLFFVALISLFLLVFGNDPVVGGVLVLLCTLGGLASLEEAWRIDDDPL